MNSEIELGKVIKDIEYMKVEIQTVIKSIVERLNKLEAVRKEEDANKD